MTHREKKVYSNAYDKHLSWTDRMKAKISRKVRGKTEGPVRGLEMDKKTGYSDIFHIMKATGILIKFFVV